MQRKFMWIASAICTLFLSDVTSAAVTKAQAGDIAEGQVFEITKSDIASYYKMGSSGTVTFSCELTSGNSTALLFGGKNLVGNIPAVLKPGYNGYFTWTLKDTGADVGNIKVQLLTGSFAYVQCKELSFG